MDAFHLLDPTHRSPVDPGLLSDILRSAGLGKGGPRIRCPLCRWRPGPAHTWLCGCGEVWNTFRTGGLCPACSHQWTQTMCLACHRWSPHQDWYERPPDPGAGA
jgi:hypothetical protein